MADSILKDLRDLIARRQVLVIVGSGVSIGATGNAPASSWGGLLKLGVQRCRELHQASLGQDWENRVLGEIGSSDLDDLLSAAEKISKKLSAPDGGEFSRWLRETVGSLSAQNRVVLEALRDLGVPLATTNYDGLLSEVTGLPPVTWRNRKKVSRVLRGEEQGILHLHGHWEDPESVVLGIRSYDQVREDPHADAVRHALGMIRSLVFVGCGDGLQDPNFGPFLVWLGKVSAANEARHYRLALNRSVASLQSSHPPEQRVVVMGFGEGHADLAGFLRSVAPVSVSAPVTAVPPTPRAEPDEAALPKATEKRPPQIVPRGLRSFEKEDHPWYLRLTLGPRDESGFPTVISFWRDAIENWDSERAFRLALLFGPSGCGKSSLVKAGILPCLSPEVLALYVEASAGGTEQQVLKALRKAVPDLPEGQSLADSCAALVRQPALTGGRKLVVFLDQFEQWLHAHPQATDGDLVQALRHCDGTSLQAVVMVRAEFFNSVDRFFEWLGVKFQGGGNLCRLDLLDEGRARAVLREYGRAFQREPEADGMSQYEAFLDQVLSSYRQPTGDFVCAHLALLAQMLRNRDWVPETLREIGGVQGVGLDYLKSTFDPRRHGRPDAVARRSQAMALFACLLPAEGTEIRGQAQSAATLAAAAGLRADSPEFHSLIALLDDQLKLITPTEVEGEGEADSRYFQLTHDYLVPSLRSWLSEEDTRTCRGRARRALKERAAQWKVRPEIRSLPFLWEYAQILLFVREHRRNTEEKALMRAAGVLWSVMAMCFALVGVAAWEGSSRYYQAKARTPVQAIASLPNPQSSKFSEFMKELQSSPRSAKTVLDQEFHNTPPGSAQANITFALAELGGAPDFTLVTRRSTNPASRTAMIHSFPGFAARPWFRDLVWRMAALPLSTNTNDADLRSAMCAGLALVPTNRLPEDLRSEYRKALEQLYRDAPDGGTHSAARCALTRWEIKPTPITRPKRADHPQWFMNDIGMTMIRVREGEFIMGSSEGDEHPHRVQLTRPFYILDREVTVDWFHRFLAEAGRCSNAVPIRPAEDSTWEDRKISPDPQCPMQNIRWEDAVGFCNWLSCLEGKQGWYLANTNGGWEPNPRGEGYRLPTEAEWEYACRAVSGSKFAYGDSEELLEEYEWPIRISEGRTWPAGAKLPNLWGLFDVHGSVSEWCQDWYGEDYYRNSSEADPPGPNTGSSRVVRGGSWDRGPSYRRSTIPRFMWHRDRKNDIGFRCVWLESSSP